MSFNTTVKKITGSVCDTCQNSKHFHKPDKEISLRKQGIKYSCLKNKVIEIDNKKEKPCGYYSLKFSIKKNMALRKIKPQFPASHEGILMFSIISQAVNDLKDAKHKKTALSFLSGDMPQAELCGVSSNWITGVLHDCHVI